jgi:hypothetical protein
MSASAPYLRPGSQLPDPIYDRLHDPLLGRSGLSEEALPEGTEFVVGQRA